MTFLRVLPLGWKLDSEALYAGEELREKVLELVALTQGSAAPPQKSIEIPMGAFYF